MVFCADTYLENPRSQSLGSIDLPTQPVLSLALDLRTDEADHLTHLELHTQRQRVPGVVEELSGFLEGDVEGQSRLPRCFISPPPLFFGGKGVLLRFSRGSIGFMEADDLCRFSGWGKPTSGRWEPGQLVQTDDNPVRGEQVDPPVRRAGRVRPVPQVP